MVVSSLHLTEAEKSFFHEHGFVVLDRAPLLPEKAQIEALQTAMAACFRGDFDTGLYPDEWHWREGISRPDATREICNAWKSNDTVRDVVLAEEVGALGGQLYAHWNTARVGQDDLVWKPPRCGAAAVGYHVDSDYISTQFVEDSKGARSNSITVWIPLDDADEENGVLEFVAGLAQTCGPGAAAYVHRLPRSGGPALPAHGAAAGAGAGGARRGGPARRVVPPSGDCPSPRAGGLLLDPPPGHIARVPRKSVGPAPPRTGGALDRRGGALRGQAHLHLRTVQAARLKRAARGILSHHLATRGLRILNWCALIWGSRRSARRSSLHPPSP
ncbi:unnamed protein product [Amoebophrya sp. A120]|nr:unnamed protein product [Amoebophrya sp. A120]|eukprot:GSA120T00010954001.1